MSCKLDYISDDFLADAQRHMQEMTDGMPLFESLVALQVAYGLDYAAAEANAERCIAATAACQTLHNQVSEDAMAVMDRFFSRLSALEPPARMDALHRILFGLTVYDDPFFAGQLDDGATPMEVYDQWLNARDISAATPAGMEGEIRRALEAYSLSPAAMRRLTWQMCSGKGCLAAAEALGERGRNLKCLMAMELWIHNRDTLSMEEAAGISAASVEIQAVSDALQKRMIARDTAKKILLAVGVAAIIAGAAVVLYHSPNLLAGLRGTLRHPVLMGGSVTAADMEALHALTNQTAVKIASDGISLGVVISMAGYVLTSLSDAAADLVARIAGPLPVRKATDEDSALQDLTKEKTASPVTIYAQYPTEMEIPDSDIDSEPVYF